LAASSWSQDDGPAAGGGGLEVADLLGQGGEIASGGLKEGLAGGAELEGVVVEQPGGQAAEIPAGADIGARAEDGVHAGLVDEGEEVTDVVVALEVEGALAGFDAVPEDGGLDGVEAGEAGGVDALGPGLAGEALEVEGSGDDPDALAVDGDGSAVEVDRWHGVEAPVGPASSGYGGRPGSCGSGWGRSGSDRRKPVGYRGRRP
jgi:hypothetical protein